MADRQPAPDNPKTRSIARLGASVPGLALLALALLALPTASMAKDRTFAEAAEAAEAVLNALAKGEDLTALNIFHRNYTHEPEPIAKLAGCRPELLEGSRQGRLWVDWTCPDASNNIFTQIYFSDGEMTSITFQPMRGAMQATPVAIEASDLGTPDEINIRFVSAVRDGEDPTLGGIIPITDAQLAKLADMNRWDAPVMVEEDASIEQRWARRARSEGDAATTRLFFNDEGQPIGLWIFEMQILSVIVSSEMVR